MGHIDTDTPIPGPSPFSAAGGAPPARRTQRIPRAKLFSPGTDEVPYGNNGVERPPIETTYTGLPDLFQERRRSKARKRTAMVVLVCALATGAGMATTLTAAALLGGTAVWMHLNAAPSPAAHDAAPEAVPQD